MPRITGLQAFGNDTAPVVESARGPREAPEGSEAEPSRQARASGGGAPRALKNAEAPAARARRWKGARQSRAAKRAADGGGAPSALNNAQKKGAQPLVW